MKNQKGNITLIVLGAVVILILSVLLINKKKTEKNNPQSPTTTYTSNPSATPESFNSTSDSDVKTLDADFNKVDSANFSDSELSNTTLGL